MAEGARLESVYAGNRIAGSNPALSARRRCCSTCEVYTKSMKITKSPTPNLIIDPGIFSPSLTDFTNVHAVVITHIHPDHFDPKKKRAHRNRLLVDDILYYPGDSLVACPKAHTIVAVPTMGPLAQV